MRSIFSLGCLCALLLAFPAADVFACGDKYLSVGRGARFQRGYVSLHPVSVVVFKSRVTGQQSFLSRLKIAGHRLTVTTDLAKLEEIVSAGQYDVLLADFENAPMIEDMLSRQKVARTFLPVIDGRSTLRGRDAKKYSCVLDARTGKKQENFLAVLDAAVAARLKAQPVVCDSTEM